MVPNDPSLLPLLSALPAASQATDSTPYEQAMAAIENRRHRHALMICQRHREILGARMDCVHPSRKGQRPSLLASACRSPFLFRELLSMGAWPNHADVGAEQVRILMDWGSPGPDHARIALLLLRQENVDLLSLKACSAALESSGRAAPSWDILARHLLSAGKFALALEIFEDQGISPGEPDLKAMDGALRDRLRFWNALRDPQDGERAQRAQIERAIFQRASAIPDPRLINHAWTEAVIHGCADDLRWMGAKGWMPQSWTALPDDERQPWLDCPEPLRARAPSGKPERSLIEAALSAKQRGIAQALAQIPQALEALRRLAPPPERLKDFTSSELALLRGWGVDIFKQDEQSQNFLHLWAKEDGRKPRAGWAAIAKLDAGALEARDCRGQTSIVKQMEALPPGAARQEFAKLASNIAMRELGHAAPKAPKAPKADRPRL